MLYAVELDEIGRWENHVVFDAAPDVAQEEDQRQADPITGEAAPLHSQIRSSRIVFGADPASQWREQSLGPSKIHHQVIGSSWWNVIGLCVCVCVCVYSWYFNSFTHASVYRRKMRPSLKVSKSVHFYLTKKFQAARATPSCSNSHISTFYLYKIKILHELFFSLWNQNRPLTWNSLTTFWKNETV